MSTFNAFEHCENRLYPLGFMLGFSGLRSSLYRLEAVFLKVPLIQRHGIPLKKTMRVYGLYRSTQPTFT